MDISELNLQKKISRMDPRKLAKLNINEFIKDSSPARLQSLRLPRDLSLGGTKCKKKQVYKPNVNVVRNKFKLSNEKKPEKVKQKKEKEFNKNRFLQSTGIFSHGINSGKVPEKLLKRVDREVLVLPEPLKKENKQPDEKIEAATVQDIKHVEESDNETAEAEAGPSFRPVHFRFTDEETVEAKTDTDCNLNDYLPPEYSKKAQSRSSANFTLWQMPDGLPFKSEASPSKIGQDCDCSLRDLPEGQIGKICVRKSGKIEVYIGDIRCQLDAVQADNFKEELSVLDINSKTCAILGDISKRFVLKPDLRTVLPLKKT